MIEPFTRRDMRVHSRLFLAALLVVFVGSGCASKFGTQATEVNHYPDCYAPINDLRENEFAVQKGVATGAMGGALLGALIGYAATGKASGAIAGAAAGGIAGGTVGGVYSQGNKEQEDARLLAEYNASLDNDTREMNKATAAAKVARQCYERQFTVAVSEYKAKRLTKAQFNSRYKEVVSGMEEAANLLGETNKNSSRVVAEYDKAITEEARSQNVSLKKTSGAKAANKTASGRRLSALAQKTSTMQRSVNAGQEEERLLRERLAATQKQAQDLLS